MNRFLKWILAGVGIVVVLLVIVTFVLPKVVDPNNYKEKVRAVVYDRTGRELTIGEEIEWTVFPSIGLDLRNLSLSNRAGFGDQPMLTVGEARVSVKLIPMFRNKIEIGQIYLTGVSAYLRQNADGQNNWEDLTPALSDNTVMQQVVDGAVAKFEIEISDGSITLHNTNQSVEIPGGNAVGMELGQPFDMKGQFTVNMVQEELAGEVRFGGRVQPASNGKWLGIEGIDTSFKGEKGVAGKTLPLEMTATANAEVDLSTRQAKLSDFVFRLFDLAVNGDLNVTSLSSTPSYTGVFKLNEFSPKSLMKELGMEELQTEDETVLTRMSGDMKFAGAPGDFNMQELSVKLDKSTFNGTFSIKGSDHSQLDYDFEIDSLNLDNYSSAVKDESGENSETESRNPIQAFGIFFILPGGGDLSIGELVASGLTVTDINVTTSSKISELRLFPISAKLYGGQQQGDIKLDISGSSPILTTNQILTGIQVEGFLKDLTGNAKLEGTGDFYMKIRTDLTNSEIARRSLSGDIGLSVIDGAIVGIDVADSINFVASTLGKQTKPAGATEQDKKTEFGEFIVTGIFDKGILRSDDLTMLSPLLTATGKGSINLVNETINYVLKPMLVNDMNVEGLDKFSGTPIPVKITGSVYEPEFSVDIISGLTGSQKAQLDEKKAELTNSLLNEVLGSKKKKKKKDKDKEEYR